MKPDAICIFIGPSISIFISGSPIHLHYRMLTIIAKNFGNESYFKFCYRISIIQGNPQMLPQIRIDPTDVEAASCLNVEAQS
jgi:hypothetical protein